MKLEERQTGIDREVAPSRYDLLIDEGSDPVYDPGALGRYMDRWDGQPFWDALRPGGDGSVLEIGAGTADGDGKAARF